MERIAILCPEVREHPALSPFFSIPEKANKRVKRVNSQALEPCAQPLLKLPKMCYNKGSIIPS